MNQAKEKTISLIRESLCAIWDCFKEMSSFNSPCLSSFYNESLSPSSRLYSNNYCEIIVIYVGAHASAPRSQTPAENQNKKAERSRKRSRTKDHGSSIDKYFFLSTRDSSGTASATTATTTSFIIIKYILFARQAIS